MTHTRLARLLAGVVLSALMVCSSAAWAVRPESRDPRRSDSGPELLPFTSGTSELPAGAALIEWSQYRQMVLSGDAEQLAPKLLAAQRREAAARDRANARTIREFLARNPSLTGLQALYEAEPKPSDRMHRYGRDWQVDLDSGQQIVVMGRSFELAGMADSIRASTSRTAQLALYRSWYGQLPVGAFDPATGAAAPTPGSLANAPLATIQRALGAIAANWQTIAALQPVGPISSQLDCNREIGASSVHGDTAFQPPTNANAQSGCGRHDPQGIYANFDFPNKGYLTCVKDQVARGTCHTFATISATEMVIGRTHGVGVNLSEQDEMEHLRLLWDPVDLYADGETPSTEIQLIQSHHYFFAYENRWDYNPSFHRRVRPNGNFVHSCDAPYPGNEACSDTSPQAPLFCAIHNGSTYCALADAGIPEGPDTITSGGMDFWNPANPDLSVGYLLLNLAFNNGVVYSFGVTDEFMGGGNHGFIPYDAADLQTGGAGHAVHVVGYVSNQELAAQLPNAPPGSGGGYFIIKNSWGPCWGDGGYGYLPVDYVKARVWEATAVSGVN